MLDEFLKKHLEEILAERVILNERFEELNQKENEAHEKIARLLEKEDVGLELFSPRNTGDSVKEQIVEIQRGIEEIQISIARVSELIEENQERKEKYEKLLSESKSIDKNREQNTQKTEMNPVVTEQCADQKINCELNSKIELAIEQKTTESLEYENQREINDVADKKENENDTIVIDRSNLLEILKRVEKSMNYAYSNKDQCKNELRNLQYYIKALLSKI